MPINKYNTDINIIGAKKNKRVAYRNECSIITRSSTMVHHVSFASFTTIPVCMACGVANAIDKIQMRKMNFIARESLDMVCERNG